MSITLYTVSFNGYWEKYGQQWSMYVNKLNTEPDEIIIVSDVKIDTSFLNNKNIKNIILDYNKIKHGNSSYRSVASFRNAAIKESSCDWVVASDLDDIVNSNYLDNLDYSADVHAFSFFEKPSGKNYYPKEDCLDLRLYGNKENNETNLIPGTSAIKRYIFNNVRYEEGVYEDKVFYATLSKMNLKIAFDDQIRFIYTGFNPKEEFHEKLRVTHIFCEVLKNNRNIYMFWFDEDITENRKKCIDSMKNNSNVNIVLLNADQFQSYENEEIKIHPAFKYLSSVHKSDYARAYMMYFYGEGYSDIKDHGFDWNPYFNELFLSNKDAISCGVPDFELLGNIWKDDKDMYEALKKNHRKIGGGGHFIFKPKTKFAYDWLIRIHKILDDKYKDLENNPALHPYQVSGGIHQSFTEYVNPDFMNNNYPLSWTEIGGSVRIPLEYENNFDTFITSMPMVNMKNYR